MTAPLPPLARCSADLIHSVAKTGGHLGSSLGVVELSVALHHVFNTPVRPCAGRGWRVRRTLVCNRRQLSLHPFPLLPCRTTRSSGTWATRPTFTRC
jgi:hypothetical protein